MSAFKINIASKEPIAFGEGPHWDDKSQILYYVNCFGKDVVHLKTYGNDTTQSSFKVNSDRDYLCFATPVNQSSAVSAGPANEFVVVAQEDIGLVLRGSSEFKKLYEYQGGGHAHDGKCDSKGRLWFGKWQDKLDGYTDILDKAVKHGGALCSFSSGIYREHTQGFTGTNGICWSPNEDMIYVADSLESNITGHKFDINTGSVDLEKKIVFELDKEKLGYDKKSILDGLITDVKGNLWVVVYLASKVLNIDIETGKIINEITLEPPLITSLCYGGQQLSELYITSAFMPLPQFSDHVDPTRKAGHTFKVTCENDNSFKGVPMHPFVK